MDDIVFYLYNNGVYLVIALAVIKLIILMLYKGFDIAYMIENFLLIYPDPAAGSTPERTAFRKIHNIFTFIFYAVALAWLAILMVVKLVK